MGEPTIKITKTEAEEEGLDARAPVVVDDLGNRVGTLVSESFSKEMKKHNNHIENSQKHFLELLQLCNHLLLKLV